MPHKRKKKQKRKETEKISLKRCGFRYRPKKEALFYAVPDKKVRGSLTVEAALSLPLLLAVMAAVLFLYDVMQVEYAVENALEMAAAKTAVQTVEHPLILEQKARTIFYREMWDSGHLCEYVTWGLGGFSWQGTKVDEEYIDLRVSYQVKTPVPFLPMRSFRFSKEVWMHRFHGLSCEEKDSKAGDWVYVTLNGTVYHKTRECTHLKLSIQSVLAELLKPHYAPCSLCAKDEAMPLTVYITQEGDCYHTKLSCSGLKRTVYMIPIEEIGGRAPCQRCGGGA